MTIKIDDKLKDYKWLTMDCVNIIKEIKHKGPLNILFTLEEAGFGNKSGRLIMKEKDKIIIMKNYLYISDDMKNIKLTYKNNELK